MVLPMWAIVSPWSKCLQGNKPHRNSPEPFEPCLRNLHQHALELFRTLRHRPNPAFGTYTMQHVPELSGTLRNFPRPSGINLSEPSETYLRNLRQHTLEPSEIFRNLPGICFRNLHHFTPELSGTFRNLPPEPTPFYSGTLRNLPEPASGTYTSTHRNSPEPSGTRLRNPHQHTPELSGTFRNLPPEPAPATRTGTHRSLSGLKTPLAYAVGEKEKENEKKISFGGIPNSSSIILMPHSTTWAPFLYAVVLPMWTMLSLKGVQNNQMAAPDEVAQQQATP